MSSTNKTTNYELSQFIETDKPAWLTDYNSDMRKLDTALKAVSDVADGASGGISSLTDRMTAAEGAITTNANDIDALEARADSLEAQAQSTAGTIANIQTEQTAQNLGIEAATELGYNLARPYDSASTYAVGAYVLFQNTLYKCITAVSTGEAFDPTKWLAIKATDEISGGISPTIQHFTAPGSVLKFNGSNTLERSPIRNLVFSFTDCTYIRIGNIRILQYSTQLAFDTISVTANTPIVFDFSGMTYDLIDKPNYVIRIDGQKLYTNLSDYPMINFNSNTMRIRTNAIAGSSGVNNANVAFLLVYEALQE